jgi:hypothetical protein
MCVCIKCQDPDACVSLDLDGSDNFRCLACEEEFTVADVEAWLESTDAWRKMLTWVRACPARKPEAAKV